MLMATLSGASLRAKSIRFSVKASSGVERSVLAIESLAFCAGEQIALCGPSGSGKTTLLNALLGLKLLPGADISWDNIKLLSLSPSQQDRWRREHVAFCDADFSCRVLKVLPTIVNAPTFRSPFIDRPKIPTADGYKSIVGA